MRRLMAMMAVGVLALGACSDDEPEATDPDTTPDQLQQLEEAIEGAPSCSQVFAPGRATEDVMAAYDQQPCLDDDGEVFLTVVGNLACQDGRTLHYVERYGWGITDEGWQEYAEGQDAPSFDAC